MKIKSALATQMSGSIGGMTGSHNAGGMYLRARAIPVNTNTQFQQQVRTSLTAQVTIWTEILSPAQREAWELYAENVPVVDALGDARNLSGQNWFIAANTPRGQLNLKFSTGLSLVQTAPGTFDRGDFTTPSGLSIEETGNIEFEFENTDNWANESGSVMLVFMGRPRNESRKFFGGPYRLVGVVEGDDSVAPTSPFTISSGDQAAFGWPPIAGQVVTLAFAVSRADGRLSTRRRLTTTVVAP